MKSVVAIAMLAAGTAHAGPELDALTRGAPRCDAARKHCFGLVLHVAVGEQGPIAKADWIAAQLAGANKHFAAIDVGWQIAGSVELAASAIRVEDRRERHALGAMIAGPVIDVFVVERLDDVDVAGAIAWGVTWPGKGGRKFIIISTQAWERTLAHELGHVFGLPHSSYPISIMNKTPRDEPPIEQRTFADEEIAKMRPHLVRLARVLAQQPASQ